MTNILKTKTEKTKFEVEEQVIGNAEIILNTENHCRKLITYFIKINICWVSEEGEGSSKGTRIKDPW